MASPVSRKRVRRAHPAAKSAPRTESPSEAEIKTWVKEAVREALAERARREQPARGREALLPGKSPEELVALARQARGNWKASEGTGSSVEIVRRLRDEWEHRP